MSRFVTLENKLIEILPSLDNFMSYGADVLKARPDHRQKVLDMYCTAMTSPQLGDDGKINGRKLTEPMLLNLHGHVDDNFIDAVLYNASAILHFMEAYKPVFSGLFVDRWFAAITDDAKLLCVYDKRNPRGIEGWVAGIVGGLNIFKTLPQAVAKRKALEDQLVEGDDDEDEDETRYVEDVWDEDSAYLEIPVREGACLRDNLRKQKRESDTAEESEIEEEQGRTQDFQSA
ncbi:hypothetical protein DFH29DRAFT_876450 [Suillus ampliporus]|nr:hypothetical protein DFH29DRAFT_876450 [Suillus ampliporus]